MGIAGLIKNIRSAVHSDPLFTIQDELSKGLSLYWDTASRILKGSGIKIKELPPDYSSLEKNFFSALFLYSFQRGGISKERRVLYAAVNQCLRGMVTGCDNILDDEYKKTLDTDLPEDAVKFRSIMDIMVSDRVLFEFLMDGYKKGDFTHEKAVSASAESLRALARSGAEEASEEGGVLKVLPPEEVLTEIHSLKTGLLFQCPWALPFIIEDKIDRVGAEQLQSALYDIGIGCQIMDDMVDLAFDTENGRHNYVASLIYYGSDEAEWGRLKGLSRTSSKDVKKDLLLKFPAAKAIAVKEAERLLKNGLTSLFAPEHRFLAEPAIDFMSGRIGADRFMSGK